VTKWIVGLALFFSLLGLFAMLQVFQITSEGAAERTLRRSLAVVSEIDVLLDRHYEDLVQRAESADANETLVLEDFPVIVQLTPDEVQTQSRDEIRETLLDRGAATLYDDGTGALRADASTGDVAVFSVGGSIDRSLNLLREDVHIASAIAMIVLGAISLLLAIALIAATRGFGRVVALGSVALVASVMLLIIAAFGWWSLDTSGGDEYVRTEFVGIAQEVAWLPVRNFAILAAAAALVTGIGALAARLTDAGQDGIR
jgi:hypothetical protein